MKPAVEEHPCCLKKLSLTKPIVSKETQLPNWVNFIGTLRSRERRQKMSVEECCAKIMASCCCLNAGAEAEGVFKASFRTGRVTVQ